MMDDWKKPPVGVVEPEARLPVEEAKFVLEVKVVLDCDAKVFGCDANLWDCDAKGFGCCDANVLCCGTAGILYVCGSYGNASRAGVRAGIGVGGTGPYAWRI